MGQQHPSLSLVSTITRLEVVLATLRKLAMTFRQGDLVSISTYPPSNYSIGPELVRSIGNEDHLKGFLGALDGAKVFTTALAPDITEGIVDGLDSLKLMQQGAPAKQVFTDAVATAKAQQEVAEAERQRLANEVAAQAQQTAEADAAARDRRNAASTESLIQNENQWATLLQGMIFVPTDVQADLTQVEAERSNLATLMLSMTRGVMWNNKLLQAHLRTERQQRQKHQQDMAALTDVVRAAATQQQQQQQLLNSTLVRINSIEAKTSAAPGCTTDATKQLNERIDHVVTIIGELGDFTSPATISSTMAAIKTSITKLQTRPDAATKNYKMPHFDISKFDDYNKTDTLTWWQSFLTEASCRTVPADIMMKVLYLQLIGGAQAWMNHLAATKKCTIAKLHTHITWKEFEKLWFTRFMVRNVVKAAMNEVYTCSQGSMPTRDWTTKWQKIVTTPGFDLSFPNQRSEFFSRSCAGLRNALGNEYDYASFQAILDRANLVIQTDDKAANERQSQPHYVAKQGYQRPAHNNAVISEETVDLHAAAASSSDGGIIAALPPKHPKRVRKNKATQETASTGTGQQPWTTYKITKEVYDLRQRYGYCLWCNGVTHLTAQCPEKGKARVPLLEQCHEDNWHPVEYFSQKVPLVNTLDDARKKELLAFVTVLKRWCHFLLGRRRFKWNTDNNPLTFYKTQDTVTSTIGRWMYYIDQFDFDPCHIPGLANRAADALSRRPDFCAIVTMAFDLDDDLQPHFVKGYKSDPTYSTLYAELSSDHPPASHYRISDGFLLLHTRGKDMLVVPQDCILWTRLLGEFHDARLSAHLAPELARLLHTGWITNQGVPEDIVSDRDTRFMSAFWTSLMAESGTTMKPSSAQHLQTDGQTERAHQTAQMMLRTLIRPNQKDWVDRLPDIEFAYNTSVHPAICVTPFELHHGGEKARIFADLLLPQAADIDVPCSPASVRKYRDLLIKARTTMQKAQIRMQQQANRRRLPCPFREGDLVWVLSEEFALEQDVSRKLLPKWFGPWEVTSAVGDDPAGPSFVVIISPHITVHRVFHASKLAIYTPPSADEFPGRRSQDPPSMDGHQEVERVITLRKYGNKPMQFKVTFKQCAPDDTRWISSADLQTSAPLTFAEYEKRRFAKEAVRPARPIPVSNRQLRPRRVGTRGGTTTKPYTAEQEAKAAALLKERREKKEAKKKALMEEQAAKLKKIEEEMAREKERLKREEEEKLKAVEEEEEVEEQPLERRREGGRGESSGIKEDQLEKKITEWVAGLSLGEEEEALMYVPREEQGAAMREWDAEEDPLKRQAIEDEKRMEWKFRLTRERKRRMEAASQAAKESEEVKKQREQMATQVDLLGKMEIMARNKERLA
ncbi:hypothetical protein CBR_g49453 [Chara braunii]|uniref:Integrase catalytic domain-containing protein n=1 Tax=Chara braunii TaxID=69332 RepID=A0A388K4W0_CHABU|nr:hypothetical protein CBR_g49453 [Chara braunii]|eukprot:GBG65090.1 hypothetical protein CBR_g49453 [Chara braunii]